MATRSKSASYLSAKINFPARENTDNYSKRRRDDIETPTILVNDTLKQTDSQRTITPNDLLNDNGINQKQAMKLDRLLDKQARYESHISFLKRSHGLNLQLEPTIGNHDQEFFDNWYQKLNKFSFELMGDIVKFCETTKTNVSEQIKQVDETLKSKTTQPKYNEITKALDENQEARKKNLQYRKNKKFYRLKYHPNQTNQPTQPTRIGRAPSSDEEESQPPARSFRRDRSNSRNKQRPTFAQVLKGQSKTDHSKMNTSSNRPRHITHPNIDRDEQISKLQHQINDLRNQRNSSNNSITPKNLNPAPQSGAETTEDIVKLINSTMLTLTAFASRLENPDLLQTPRGM